MTALPPHDVPAFFWIDAAGQQQGPEPLSTVIERIAYDQIPATTPVWWQGAVNWAPFTDNADLKALLDARLAPAPAPVPEPVAQPTPEPVAQPVVSSPFSSPAPAESAAPFDSPGAFEPTPSFSTPSPFEPQPAAEPAAAAPFSSPTPFDTPAAAPAAASPFAPADVPAEQASPFAPEQASPFAAEQASPFAPDTASPFAAEAPAVAVPDVVLPSEPTPAVSAYDLTTAAEGYGSNGSSGQPLFGSAPQATATETVTAETAAAVETVPTAVETAPPVAEVATAAPTLNLGDPDALAATFATLSARSEEFAAEAGRAAALDETLLGLVRQGLTDLGFSIDEALSSDEYHSFRLSEPDGAGASLAIQRIPAAPTVAAAVESPISCFVDRAGRASAALFFGDYVGGDTGADQELFTGHLASIVFRAGQSA